MTMTEQDVLEAEQRSAALRAKGAAVAARYDRRTGRIVVELNTGLEIAFPTRLAQGLADATPDQLAEIEISPAGLGLHWPKLDADLYVPALLEGAFGSKRWMAAQLGAAGGRVHSQAKAEAARENGRKGGRPPKPAQDDLSTAKPAKAVTIEASFQQLRQTRQGPGGSEVHRPSKAKTTAGKVKTTSNFKGKVSRGVRKGAVKRGANRA
ncbi:MAG TPA: DUF2442 domain-containing protein [Roseiarcus sp.]|jgi:hypothetical protein